MKDIAEFEKLFKVNFPVQEHHQYYLDTMMKSPFKEYYNKPLNKIMKYLL